MAADKLVFPLKGLFGGITALPPTQQPEAVVADLLDQRCGDSFERVVYQKLADPIALNTSYRYLDFLGQMVKLSAESYAYMGDQLLYRNASGDDFILRSDGVHSSDFPGSGLRFVGMRGSLAYLEYPGDSCFYLTEPGAFPTFNATTNPVPSKMVFQQGNSNPTLGVAGFGAGMVAFGERTVSYWDFTIPRQTILSTSGCLSQEAWSGGDGQVWWVSQDSVLYNFDGKQVNPVGYSWLFKQYTRAFLTWLEPTKDLFITLDKGNSTTLVDPVTYLYHNGLTRLSEVVFHPALGTDFIYGLDELGQTIKVNLPARDQGTSFNWATFTPPMNLVLPSRPPDLVTDWADFYSTQIKSFLALEVVSNPTWPVYFSVTSDTGATDIGIITLEFPVGEVSVSGHKFILEIWFPDPAAGPDRITDIRTHIQAEDLRGIYALAVGKPTLNG